MNLPFTGPEGRLWLTQVGALIRKEFAQIVRDPSSYLIALVLPALFIFLFGYGISLDPATLRLGIVDQSRTMSSRALVEDFAHSPWFEITEFASAADAATAMRESRVQGFVCIREDYERVLSHRAAGAAHTATPSVAESATTTATAAFPADAGGGMDADASGISTAPVNTGGSSRSPGTEAGDALSTPATRSSAVYAPERAVDDTQAVLQLVVDGTEPNTASFLQGYAQGLISLHTLELAKERGLTTPGITIVDRFWYNPSARSVNFLVPGSITVIMTLIGTLLTSLVFAREWERGTMEAMLATPASRGQLILGKLVPYFALGMFGLFLCTALAILVFDVPFRGSYAALFLISSVFMLCALGQGLLISVHMKGQLVAAEAGLFSGFLPALLLSGFVFDLDSMPPVLQWIAQLLPATHFNFCLRTLFLAGSVPDVLVPRTLCLLALAVLLTALVYRGLKKSVE